MAVAAPWRACIWYKRCRGGRCFRTSITTVRVKDTNSMERYRTHDSWRCIGDEFGAFWSCLCGG